MAPYETVPYMWVKSSDVGSFMVRGEGEDGEEEFDGIWVGEEVGVG